MNAPPGWYQDPERPSGHTRFWDGRAWTNQRWAAQPMTTTLTPTRGSSSGWFGRHKVLTAVLATVLVAGAANATSGDQPSQPETRSGDRPVATASESPSESSQPQERTRKRRASSETAPKSTPKGDEARPKKRRVRPAPKPPRNTAYVTRVIDGDTLELANGESVRLVGIDTPEVGECGYERAAENLERLVLGERVRLGMSDEDRDGYGRLLRYVDVGPMDAGLRLIKNGMAIARYDSRDGYGYHPREPRYIAADRGAPGLTCRPVPLVQKPPAGGGGSCAPGYSPCVPPYGPDLDCPDVDGPIRVSGSDPHGLDADGDGIACE